MDGATEPTVADSQSTTTLVNTADWTTGDVKFCLRIKLMLQLTDGTDLLWHQMDFKFTVTVGIEGGTADVYFVENGGVAESLIFQENGVETSDGHSITVGDAVAPTFATSLAVVGPFGYGDDIPITITFNHPLDIFTYSVDAENVVPVDELNAQLMSGGDPIPLRSSSFVMDSINHATGITGTLTMTFPLVLYQLPSTSSVRIKIPVSWTGKTRRHLRELTEQMANSDYTGPSSGSVNELVEVELDPYIDGSGAIIGFTLRGMVALSCAAATVILH